MKRLSLIAFVSFLFATSAFAAARPTFVLVHGALFTGSGWSRLQSSLQEQGYNVVTLDVPGRNGDGVDPKTVDINVATAKVCRVVKAQKGRVVLVGHSQGGALITQALNDCPLRIKSLVYLAAVVPLNGEIAFQALDPSRDTNFNLCATANPEAGLFQLNRSGPLESSFFADLRALDSEFADLSLASMVSEPFGIGTTKLNYDEARFAAKPKFYIETLEDQVLTLETQRVFQARTSFVKVYSIQASHSPMLSKPKELADMLIDSLSK